MKTVISKVQVYIITSLILVGCNTTTNKIIEPLSSIDTIQVKPSIDKKWEPIVFITGYDSKNENFYTNARNYFINNNYKVVDDKYSLEEIILWLNKQDKRKTFGDIHIVNKSDPFRGLTLETIVRGEPISIESLRRSITKGTLPVLNNNINSNTNFIFHANGLGENLELMKVLKDALCADELPNIVASPYHSIFSNGSTQHYLAKAYYIFYPTAYSPGKVDLSKELARKYNTEKNIDWYDTLHNYEERFVGDAYSTQFVVPVKFRLDFHNSDNEIPIINDQEQMIAYLKTNKKIMQQLSKLNIPLDKFRWMYSLHNSVITIKGSATGICIYLPLIKPYGELEHIKPEFTNKRLYAMK